MRNLIQLFRDTIVAEFARLRLGLFSIAASLILLAVAGGICLIGSAFLLYGVFDSLSRLMPTWMAGGLIALGVIVIAMLLAYWGRQRLVVRSLSPPLADATSTPAAEQMRKVAESGINAGEMLKRSGLRPGDLAIAAFIAGLVMSRSTRERHKAQKN